MSNRPDGDPSPFLRTLSIEDRQYNLASRTCTNCNNAHYEVYRWCGASFSRYLLPPSFHPDDFEAFVTGIDDALLMSASDAIQEFHRELSKANSSNGIEVDGSFAFRLLEYGRHRCSTLQKLEMLDALISPDEAKNDGERAVRAAFELGMATAEYRVLHMFEDYMFAGMALSEWREEGLPKARAERLRQGMRSRSAIIKAAEILWAKNPSLARNDSETARLILKLRLPELQKNNGAQLGFDAITKHLRASRNCKTH